MIMPSAAIVPVTFVKMLGVQYTCGCLLSLCSLNCLVHVRVVGSYAKQTQHAALKVQIERTLFLVACTPCL